MDGCHPLSGNHEDWFGEMREGGQYLRHFRKRFIGAWMVGESSVSFGEKAKFGTRQSMILSSICRVFQKDCARWKGSVSSRYSTVGVLIVLRYRK